MQEVLHGPKFFNMNRNTFDPRYGFAIELPQSYNHLVCEIVILKKSKLTVHKMSFFVDKASENFYVSTGRNKHLTTHFILEITRHEPSIPPVKFEAIGPGNTVSYNSCFESLNLYSLCF